MIKICDICWSSGRIHSRTTRPLSALLLHLNRNRCDEPMHAFASGSLLQETAFEAAPGDHVELKELQARQLLLLLLLLCACRPVLVRTGTAGGGVVVRSGRCA